MREILFKGKRVDNGEWIRGDLIATPFIRNETQQNIIYILDITKADYDCFEDLVEDNGIFEVDPETVCQYTGLMDKNSRKIFEGDILEFTDCEFGKENYTVFWNRVEWGIRSELGNMDDLRVWDSSNWEVIGNIFDNPELLKGDKK